ncbi:PspC domain-containing protein [Corynebacterium poyangense]|uniref:PspC domain-containing protein n=1 Tax=Corynebacterium poyangense TaxID=2684405 RepID=A0A7H0SNA5_9CORY|nr:PspC domain-containing protein [Corynebacterium poyangense]MBZ8177055.1 PspC domain-containing protein [Corynebacterium poyangense]QNQ90030.1 PspC domain-containing protein [Corynebacterium poyangense]
MSSQVQRKLRRSSVHRILGGVCGGLGQRFGIPIGLVRLLFVLSIILPGPQFLYYVIAWVIIPLDTAE